MKAIELFAGAGGLGMGIGRAGFQPQAVVEWDRWCCDTLRQNRERLEWMNHWPEPLEGDVRGVDFRSLEGKVDLVSGGPPCQPFSLGGRHRAHYDERDMWPQAVRVVREVKPQAFIFENVKGLTRATFATYLAYIVHQLEMPEIEHREGEGWIDHLGRLERAKTAKRMRGLRYNVVWRVLNAANYGVPQKRERVVFVGFRNDLGVQWKFPEETHSLDALLWEQRNTGEYWDRHKVSRAERLRYGLDEGRLIVGEKPETEAWRTVRDAISNLPDPELDPRRSARVDSHRFQPGARSYPGHTGSPLDAPAKTLKAGVHGVPGGENMLRRPDGSVRYFTIRESARLQTFPNEYQFHGAWSECMRQIGNAVPVDLAHAVARNVAANLQVAA